MPVLPAGCVLLAADEAAALAPGARRYLRELVRDGHVVPDRFWRAVEAMESAAHVVRDRCHDNAARDNVGETGDVVRHDPLGATAAALLLGCSRQAVIARIHRGTLPAERDAKGRYLIHPENLKGAEVE